MSIDKAQSLNILMIAAEVAPFSTQGSAEVVTTLAATLRDLGHDVRLAVPYSRDMDLDGLPMASLTQPVRVPVDNHVELASVKRVDLANGLPVYVIQNPRYLDRRPTTLLADDAAAHIFFARAAMEMLKQPEIGWKPHIVHGHDWQTAIIPNWLSTVYAGDPFYAEMASVLTIHVLAHQGIYGYHVLELAGLEQYGFIHHAEITELSEVVDLLARGIYYADAITTISECYALEIQTPEFGERLDPLLRERSQRLFGIRNGIDMDWYDPSKDTQLAARYDVDSLGQRALNKTVLQRAVGLPEDPAAPLLAIALDIGDAQGPELLAQIMTPMLENLPLQVLLLGTSDPSVRDLLAQHVQQYGERVAWCATCDGQLERLIYAGSDMFLVPSFSEPCGLHEMLAMHYGSVPIVRATGSLADTVRDYDPATETGNGFSFVRHDAMALYTAIVRATEVFKHHALWESLQVRCMRDDLSWISSAQKYVDAYRLALANRNLRDLSKSA
ncbi:MAG: glycogen synthase [Anaerolineae bacterium]